MTRTARKQHATRSAPTTVPTAIVEPEETEQTVAVPQLSMRKLIAEAERVSEALAEGFAACDRIKARGAAVRR